MDDETANQSDHDTGYYVNEVVYARRHAGKADRESDNPEDQSHFLAEEVPDDSDSGQEEGVVGREAVVWSVRDQGFEASDYEGPRVEVDVPQESGQDEGQRQREEGKDCHPELLLPG